MQKYLVAALIAACSISVVAGEIEAYNATTVGVHLATSYCPSELSDLSKDGRIDTASVQSIQGEDIYTLNFTAEAFAPAFRSYPVGTLTITKSPNVAAEHEYSCLVTKL